MRILLVLLFFTPMALAKSNHFSCSNLKHNFTGSEIIEVKKQLANNDGAPVIPSKVTLAVSIGDLDYIKKHRSFEVLAEALEVTLSSDLSLFNDLLALLEDSDINKQGEGKPTLLMVAADCGQTQAVTKLLSLGADINQGIATSGINPLNQAVMNRNTVMVRHLLANGAACHRATLVNGKSVFDLAKNQGNKEVSLLLDRCLIK